MKAFFRDLKWKKGEVSFMSGPFYSEPANAIRGRNDVYIFPESAELHLVLYTENGQYICENIIDTVKGVNGWKKISQNRYNKLFNRFSSKPYFDIDANGRIMNIDILARF